MSSSPLIEDAMTPERKAKRRRLEGNPADGEAEVVLSPGAGRRRAVPDGAGPQSPPSRRLTRKTSLGGGTPESHVLDGLSPSREEGAVSTLAAVSRTPGVHGANASGVVARADVGRRGRGRGRGAGVSDRGGRGRGGEADAVAGTAPASVRGSARSEAGDRAARASATPASARGGVRGGGANAEVAPAALRRSARVVAVEASSQASSAPASASASARGGGRIVQLIGRDRVDDVAADERRRSAEGARRGDQRREAGARGRMTTFSGEDLDRSAGGAWRAGQR